MCVSAQIDVEYTIPGINMQQKRIGPEEPILLYFAPDKQADA